MDLDKCFVAVVVKAGREAIRLAIDKGVDEECLAGDGLVVWRFVLDHLKRYSEVPDLIAIQGRTGVILDDPPPGPPEFFIDEVLNRRLHNALRDELLEITKLYKAQEPQAAYTAFEASVRKLRGLNVAESRTVELGTLGSSFLAYYDKIKAGYRGVQTPWPTVNDATLGFWPEDFVLYVARLGVGKCADAGSLLTDPVTGLQRTIEDVYGDSGVTHTTSWSAEEGVHVRPITAKVDTGTKECLRFTLATGRSVVVTPEHPFLTPDGWRRADELAEGESVAIPAQMPAPQAPQRMDSAELDVLAIMLADGACTQNGVNFTKGDSSVVAVAEKAAQVLGLRVRSEGSSHHIICGKGVTRNRAAALMKEHGLRGVLSKDKQIPEAVFRLGREQLGRFIAVFWSCDGYIADRGPEITLASERLLVQLQSLLLRLGVQSRLSYKRAKYQGGERDAWRLRVYAHSYEAFFRAVPLWGTKRGQLEQLVASERNPNVGFPKVSEALAAEVRALAGSQAGRWSGGKLKEVGRRLGWSGYFGVRDLFGKGGTLLLDRFKMLCEVYGVESKYAWLWDSGVFWDVVSTVEQVGDRKVYDLTVQPTSSFVANDIILHNTWALLLIANHAWVKQGKRVLFITTEMGREKIFQRWLAVRYRYPYNDLRHARLSAFADQRMRDNIEALQKSEGFRLIGGDFDFRMDSLEGAIEESEPDVVFVDGAYLLRMPGESRIERAANSFDELKRTAKRNSVPLVASTQFNRQAGNKLSSAGADKIALSDAAGWNADLIYGLIQTEDMRRDKRMLQLPLKFREGEGEEIETHWDFDTMNFDELPKGAQAAVVGSGGLGGPGPGGGGSGPSGGASGPSGGAPDPDPYGTGLLFGGDDDDKDPVPF